MTYGLSARSRAELKGVHPTLAAVVERAIRITQQDFAVHDGLRSEAEQRALVRQGASQTLNSRHRAQPDGYGHAVDLVPWISGRMRWEWPAIYPIAAAVRQAAEEQGVGLVWGGVWDRRLSDLPPTAAGLKAAVEAYVARRRAMKRSAFIDGPHYELAK